MSNSKGKLPTFRDIPDTSVIMDVLMDRLPKSANIYNMALLHSKFQKDMKFYNLANGQEDKENDKVGKDSWIIAIYHRKDYCDQQITVSAPKDPFRRLTPTSLQNALRYSQIINWKQSYTIVALDLSISQVFFELSCRIHDNVTQVQPDYFYYMDIDSVEDTEVDSLLKEIQSKKDLKKIEVKSLHSLAGIQFVTNQWKDSTTQYVGRVVKNNPSAGVILDGEIVSGIVLTTDGFIGMLNTSVQYRRKKLGTLAAKSLIVTLGKSGFVPCANVNKSNTASNNFHKKIGMKVSHAVETIAYFST